MCLKTAFRRFILRLQYDHFCVTRLLQSRKTISLSNIGSSPHLRETTFTVLDDEGRETPCNVLFTFDRNEDDHYIVYTDNTKDEDENIQVYASRYTMQGNDIKLLPINTEEEWVLIQDTLEDLQERVRKGESLDDLEDYDEENEILEPIHVCIWKRVSSWSDKMHFPVYILPPYILGVVLMHFLSYASLPLWEEIGFFIAELILMRICYDHKTGMASIGSIAITGYLYFDCLLSPWFQIWNKDPIEMKRAAEIPWLMRGSMILILLFSVAYTSLKKKTKRNHSSVS